MPCLLNPRAVVCLFIRLTHSLLLSRPACSPKSTAMLLQVTFILSLFAQLKKAAHTWKLSGLFVCAATLPKAVWLVFKYIASIRREEERQGRHAHREGKTARQFAGQPSLPRTPGGDSKLALIEFHANGFTFTVQFECLWSCLARVCLYRGKWNFPDLTRANWSLPVAHWTHIKCR